MRWRAVNNVPDASVINNNPELVVAIVVIIVVRPSHAHLERIKMKEKKTRIPDSQHSIRIERTNDATATTNDRKKAIGEELAAAWPEKIQNSKHFCRILCFFLFR